MNVYDKKLELTQQQKDILTEALHTVEKELGLVLTMHVRHPHYNELVEIESLDSRKLKRVVKGINPEYSAMDGEYQSLEEIQDKLKLLQELEITSGTKCTRCGMKLNGQSFGCIKSTRFGDQKCVSWQDLVADNTSIRTEFSGGRMSIAYPYCNITLGLP